MEIDRPDILAEVVTLFAVYETALVTNDVAVLDGLFWQHAKVVRYGATEILHGHAEIAASVRHGPRKASPTPWSGR